MLWRRPIEQSARGVIDCTKAEVTAKYELPEGNTTDTDDTSKDDTSEFDMSTDGSSRKFDSDPKQTRRKCLRASSRVIVSL